MIRESDRFAYHLRWTYIKIDPSDPTHPVKKTEVRPIRAADYRRFFEGDTAHQLKVQKVIGVEGVELVHNPTLQEGEGFREVKAESFKKVDKIPDDVLAEAMRIIEEKSKVEPKQVKPVTRKRVRS